MNQSSALKLRPLPRRRVSPRRSTTQSRKSHLIPTRQTPPRPARFKISSSLEERLYATTDANHNVTSIDDVFGAVKERFVYDPYRQSTVLSAAWASTADTLAWSSRSQGEREDATTNTIDGRNRLYGIGMGRWMQEDSAGYIDGANRYQFVLANPMRFTDPTGFEFVDGGNTGNQKIFWVIDATQGGNVGGGANNQGAGTVQTSIAPQILTKKFCGLPIAYVKKGTGIVKVIRSYTGVQPGDQGVGVMGAIYAGKRVYITAKLATSLGAHEQGHINAAAKIYENTIAPAEKMAALYRDKTFLLGLPGDTQAQVKARLEKLINWNASITAFHDKDIAVNIGEAAGTFHAWETAQGGGPTDPASGPGKIGTVNYDYVIKDRSETDPNYHGIDYSKVDPYRP